MEVNRYTGLIFDRSCLLVSHLFFLFDFILFLTFPVFSCFIIIFYSFVLWSYLFLRLFSFHLTLASSWLVFLLVVHISKKNFVKYFCIIREYVPRCLQCQKSVVVLLRSFTLARSEDFDLSK